MELASILGRVVHILQNAPGAALMRRCDMGAFSALHAAWLD